TVGLNKIFTPAASSPVAQLHAISVGNGSCYLLRLRPNQRFKRDLVILFDCGSHQFMDLGKRTVVPVLENLNIRQIDYLMLSHADIDHYSGTLDVADAITIKQVLLPAHMLEDAQQNPRKATARLLDGLEQRQIPIQVVAAGWEYQFGNHNLKLIWPPPPPEVFSGVALDTVMDIATFETIKDNDSSLVLSVKTSGRRILLTGDIQQRAMTTMLARKMDLSADIIDLPHHGSIVPSTANWLMAVGPKIAIQSASWSRLYQDKWPALLKPLNLPMQRLVTAKRGMITVQISKNGTITTTDFLSDR
ncbi:MAG: MBL fold metallo-hydrolase, partial [Phycisphaeraceae bacterium]|nr:MBL fold metallo-hydrolase [Phycisphaeraceae bacterium]